MTAGKEPAFDLTQNVKEKMMRNRMRRSNGQFRQASLRDFGMFYCEKCGGIMEIKPVIVNGFVDPMSINNPRCARCNGETEGDTGLTTRTPEPKEK